MKLGSSLTSLTGYVPGPGNYNLNNQINKKEAPKYGFGSSTRENASGNKKLNTPGPGSYKLISTIGDVPAHAMPNRPD